MEKISCATATLHVILSPPSTLHRAIQWKSHQPLRSPFLGFSQQRWPTPPVTDLFVCMPLTRISLLRAQSLPKNSRRSIVTMTPIPKGSIILVGCSPPAHLLYHWAYLARKSFYIFLTFCPSRPRLYVSQQDSQLYVRASVLLGSSDCLRLSI